MGSQVPLPEPVFVQEHEEWLVECPVCADVVFGESPEAALEAAGSHVDQIHVVLASPGSNLVGDELLSQLATPFSDEWKWAVEAVRHYFESGAYTGGMFERLDETDPNRIEALDLVAVSMLGVEIPASASLRLLQQKAAEIGELLSQIPSAPLHEVDRSVLAPGSAAYQLWDLVRSPGVARTRTSKLLGRKRPHLIPVWDSRIAHRIPEMGNHQWEWAWSWWNDSSHREGLEELRTAVGSISDISLLRVLDVAVWRYDVAIRPSLRTPLAP